MKKEGQTTIFIILAIIILVLVFGYTTLQKSKAERYFSTPENQEEINQIKSKIFSCIEISSTNSLSKIGAQGGFHSPPKEHYKIEEEKFLLSIQSFIPYYYHNQKALHPSKSVVESEFSRIFNEQLSECIGLIESDTIDISSHNPQTTLEISEDKLTIITNPNTAIMSNGNSLTLSNSQIITRNSALNDIITLYSEMSNTKVETQGFNCISCMEEFVIKKNLYIDSYNFDEQSTIFRIYENYTLDKQSWVFINQEIL